MATVEPDSQQDARMLGMVTGTSGKKDSHQHINQSSASQCWHSRMLAGLDWTCSRHEVHPSVKYRPANPNCCIGHVLKCVN